MVLVSLCTLAACFSAEITHCPTVDCPKEMVCDGHGGCALPDQLSSCSGKSDGTLCSYKDRANATINGACANGLCLPLNCGNSIVTPDEICDDGNNNSGDEKRAEAHDISSGFARH